jgi:hypothetical protein
VFAHLAHFTFFFSGHPSLPPHTFPIPSPIFIKKKMKKKEGKMRKVRSTRGVVQDGAAR